MPNTADKMHFASGVLMLPEFPDCNNRGVITDQMVPGHDHVEGYLFWRLLEPHQDQWNWDKVDEILSLMKPSGQKMLACAWLNYAPKWFVKSERYVPLQEMHTGKTVDLLSIWAPGTWWAYEHFYKQLPAKYGGQLDIIKISLPSSDFGEVGMPMGVADFTTGKGWGTFFPQAKDAWHMGMWCGDPYALQHFRKEMSRRYRSMSALNKIWGTSYTSWDQLELMRIEDRKRCPRRWLDLMEWYNNSQVEAMQRAMKIVRSYFPHALLELPLGFGCDLPQYGCDRSLLCRAVGEFGNATVRSTHGSFNRWVVPAAYWFYKRHTTVCHRYGSGFGTEPPGGDLTPAEMKRQLFEDASVSANLLYSYYQNWHTLPDVAKQWSTFCRPSKRSMVSVGVIYPNTQMALDLAEYPVGQWELFDALRPTVDMDVVDEHMMGWGWLSQYKLLINTNGKTYPKKCLNLLWQWLQKGGVLITRGGSPLMDVEGRAWPVSELKVDQSVPVGRGRIVRLDDADIPSWSAAIAQMLRQIAGRQPELHGVNPKQDGKWRTQFADRWLSYDPKTGKTRWE